MSVTPTSPRIVLIATADGDPDPFWKRAGGLVVVRLALVYALLGLGAFERGLPLMWLVYMGIGIELLCLYALWLARSRRNPVADICLSLGGISPLVFLACAAGLMMYAGAAPVHGVALAVCFAVSLALTAVQLRKLDIAKDRRALRRKKVIREDGSTTLIRTGRLEFPSMEKPSVLLQVLGLGVPLCGLVLLLPLGPARWGSDIASPLVFAAGYGTAIFSIAWYLVTSHVIATWLLVRAERAGPLA
ncbi:MAG: hypothetical protein AB8B82_14340 [Roseovarius sp.]